MSLPKRDCAAKVWGTKTARGSTKRDSQEFIPIAPQGLAHIRLWLARALCGRDFFNADASLEIDRLIVENERLCERLALYEQ